ncbi:MAG: M48 family metalloprotease [Novosphingobium sp.]
MGIFLAQVAVSGMLLGAMTPGAAPHLAIARSVAGAGLPQCTSYLADGTAQPCLPSFSIRQSRQINGWSEHGRIAFSRAALERLTPDEFALLAGHEIAHWYLGHKGSNPADELAADRLGAKLACEAGYDPAKGAGLFRYLGQGTDHPPRKARVAAVLAVPCPQAAHQSFSSR